MNHWGFVIAAYAITLVATAALVAWSWAAMRRSEALADSLKLKP